MREEVLLRKLIADGEGTGEDRRFQQINSFLRDVRHSSENRTAEAIKILKNLDSLDLSMLKQKQIADMTRNQADEFLKYAETVDKEIEKTNQKMEEAKNSLADARVIKKNRQEYSSVVKVIEQIPSRMETTRKLGEIRDELERQHERQRLLEGKLVDRRNHLQAFNIVLANFQRFVAEDDENLEEDEDDENDSAKYEDNGEDDLKLENVGNRSE